MFFAFSAHPRCDSDFSYQLACISIRRKRDHPFYSGSVSTVNLIMIEVMIGSEVKILPRIEDAGWDIKDTPTTSHCIIIETRAIQKTSITKLERLAVFPPPPIRSKNQTIIPAQGNEQSHQVKLFLLFMRCTAKKEEAAIIIKAMSKNTIILLPHTSIN